MRITCDKCGNLFDSKPLLVETGNVDPAGNKIYKQIGEDTACPKCGSFSVNSESVVASPGKKLLCD